MSSPIAPPAGSRQLQIGAAIVVALVTVLGVLRFDWPVFVVMLLYVAENVFIVSGWRSHA
jgi:hypothetical protein